MRTSITSRLFTVALTVVITLAITAGVLAFKDSRRVPPGTTVGNIDISGLNYTEAANRLTAELKLPENQQLILRQGNKTMPMAFSELGVYLDIDASIKQVKASNGLFAALANRGGGTRNLSVAYGWDDKKLQHQLTLAEAAFDRKPMDARVYLDGDTLTRTNEIDGFKTDAPALGSLISQHLQRGSLQDIIVPGQVQSPAITAAQLETVKDMLAVYVTAFTPDPTNRAHNINLSAQRINNAILLPNEVFSLNQMIGERTAASGFLPAPIYQNGETVIDIGGGVCQLASTLYNAVVAADLKITERHPHTYAVDYVAPGQDATIAWELRDFQFVNSSKSPVLITASTQKGQLQVRIYGEADDTARETKLVSEHKTITPEVKVITNRRLPAGEQVVRQKGSPGYEVITYRVESQNGKELSRTQVSADSYQSRPWIIEVPPGTNPRPGSK